MAATAGYQAGIEANQTQLSYGVETTWGVKPAVPFQAIRYMSDTLGLTKTRSRPTEINILREVSQAVTTEQSAGGTINYALSYGVIDDFIASLCQDEWSPDAGVVSIGTDITMTSTGTATLTLSSTLATKFQNITLGQYIRTSGFILAGYNNWWRVSVVTDASHISVVGPAVGANTETSSGANVKITGSSLNNSTIFKSLYIQQKFASNKFLRYGGVYVTRLTLGAQVGQFFTGAIDVVAQSEIMATVEASTGATVAAPANTVFDPVLGWVKVTLNDVASTPMTTSGLIDQVQITLENTGAAPEFTLGGSSGADGMLGGTFTASGTFRMYLKTFGLYDYFQNETIADMQFYLQDKQKNSYVLTFQNVFFMVKMVVGGPGQATFMDIAFEVNPDTNTGGTFQIDRHGPPN